MKKKNYYFIFSRHHIEAELAVLIGAVSNATYVMKVIKYEMHPKYIYNLEAMENVEHNVAILTIGCGCVIIY